MSRPLIGITVYEATSKSGHPIAALQTAYIRAVQAAGGIPLLIPNELAESGWDEVYDHFAGLLFTGGGVMRTSRGAGVVRGYAPAGGGQGDRSSLRAA